MPSALAICFSSGEVMKPWMRSALAPVYTVETVTTALLLTGYCRTLSNVKERQPISRIIRLTTVDRTGRLIKISVKFIVAKPQVLGRDGTGLFAGFTVLLICTADPLRSLSWPVVTTSSPDLTPL